MSGPRTLEFCDDNGCTTTILKGQPKATKPAEGGQKTDGQKAQPKTLPKKNLLTPK